jgi:hypothetical protein
MGGLIAKIVFKQGDDALLLEKYKSVNDIPITLLDGSEIESLKKLVEGKKLIMIVNVASK